MIAVNDPSIIHQSSHPSCPLVQPFTTQSPFSTKTTNKRQQSDPANLIVCLVLSRAWPRRRPPAPAAAAPLPALPKKAAWLGRYQSSPDPIPRPSIETLPGAPLCRVCVPRTSSLVGLARPSQTNLKSTPRHTSERPASSPNSYILLPAPHLPPTTTRRLVTCLYRCQDEEHAVDRSLARPELPHLLGTLRAARQGATCNRRRR